MKLKARKNCRRLALQALYQWHMSGINPIELEKQYREDKFFPHIDQEHFLELITKIPRNYSAIDAVFNEHLDRKLEELDGITLTILRIATFELQNNIDIPYKVVLNEAVELAKTFGAEDSFKYINGILNKVAKEIRVVEVKES